jgi:hypothetical protein
MAQDFDFANRLYYDYEQYCESALTHRRFKHSDIKPLIERLKNNNKFRVEEIGKSAEGKEIYLLTLGTGKTKVFLWSQMHGDEPTATMALFDIFNFFSISDSFDPVRKELLNKLTIYFMPMVNPDGAEIYQRRNIYEIDINRDAVRQQTPEGILLRQTFDRLRAHYGFNLHDQSTRYSVGNSFKSAALSFLAPATDYGKSIDSVRTNAIQLIGELYKTLSQFIPGHIAKYADDFEPRAFGDNFQKWGTSTILLESGGWKDDPEKQFLRKMNFITLLSAFRSIASNSFKNESLEVYDQILFNDKFIFDVVLRNLKYSRDGKSYLIDVGINLNEINFNNGSAFYYKSSIEDIGDLSVYFGYKDYDFTGMEIIPGKVFEKVFSSYDELLSLDIKELHKNGYTSVVLQGGNLEAPFTELPINILISGIDNSNEFMLGKRADFTITQGDEIRYVIINGFPIDIKNSIGEIKNGLIY